MTNTWLAQVHERLGLAKQNHASEDYIEALETVLRLHKKMPLTREEVLGQSVWKTIVRIADYYDGEIVVSVVTAVLVKAGMYVTNTNARGSVNATILYHMARDRLYRVSPGVYALVESTKQGKGVTDV